MDQVFKIRVLEEVLNRYVLIIMDFETSSKNKENIKKGFFVTKI